MEPQSDPAEQPHACTSSSTCVGTFSPSAPAESPLRKMLIFLLKAIIVVPLGVSVLWMEYQVGALVLDALMEKPYVLTGTELGWTRNAMWTIIVLGSVFYWNRVKFG